MLGPVAEFREKAALCSASFPRRCVEILEVYGEKPGPEARVVVTESSCHPVQSQRDRPCCTTASGPQRILLGCSEDAEFAFATLPGYEIRSPGAEIRFRTGAGNPARALASMVTEVSVRGLRPRAPVGCVQPQFDLRAPVG